MLREKLEKTITNHIQKIFNTKDIDIFDIDKDRNLVFYRCDNQFIVHKYYESNNTIILEEGSYLEDFTSGCLTYLQRKGEIDKLIYNTFVDEQVELLRKNKEVTFVYEGRIFNIFASSETKGWYIQIFDSFEDVESGCDSDGGLCTGSAKDAVEFML